VKTSSCGEVTPDCPAGFSGQTFEDLLNQVAEHARREHGIATLPAQATEAVAQAWRRSDAPG
jgi:predicted small metal-binding protein